MNLSFPLFFATEIAVDESYTKVIVVSLLLITGIIFVLSTLLGELCNRLNLPTVLGDLGAGMILSSSVLGIFIFTDIDNTASSALLGFIQMVTGASSETAIAGYRFQMRDFINESANIGLLSLLFVTGMESDLKELIRVGSQAATVAATGVILPLTGGTLLLIYGFNVPAVPAIFAGAALTATSIGITAKVLQEMGQLQSEEGQIILGAAILDDILGIVILALALSLVNTGGIKFSSICSN